MSEKKYWKSLEEKNNEVVITDDEFGQPLPNLLNETITEAPSGRRDFLKMLGFSLSAATFAASCQLPVKKSVPYIFKPENIIPGKATFYASTFFKGGEFNSVLVKTREGRPIKIEGNDLCPITKGGTSARAQASVLGLYDEEHRYKIAMSGGKNVAWQDLDKEVKTRLSTSNKIAIVSSSVASPGTFAAIEAFKARYNSVDHIQYDAVSYSGALDANEESFGVRALPEYKFDKADYIVSFEADFLGTYGSPVEYSKRYIKKRKVSLDDRTMSKHVQIESTPTITGHSADVRISLTPSEVLRSLVYLYNNIVSSNRVMSDNYENPQLLEVAGELKLAGKNSIVISSSPDKNVQLMVNAINHALGNIGNTVSFTRRNLTRKGSDQAVQNLVSNLQSYDTVIVYDCNPVYNVSGFKDAFEKVRNKISLSTSPDETSAMCDFIAPDNHYLESWNDVEPVAGVFTTSQPAITPLFKTRQAQQSLLVWADSEESYFDFLKKNWETNVLPRSKYSTINQLWDSTVHDGVLATKTEPAALNANFEGVASAGAAILRTANAAGDVQLHIYEKVAIGDGSFVDNPWCQETPDPVSKITWDNYVLANPTWVSENGLDPDLNTKEYKNIKLQSNGKEVTLPVVPLPGHPKGSLSVAVGYGRSVSGKAGLEVGANVFGFTDNDYNMDVSWEKTDTTKGLGATQTHFSITYQGLGGVKTRNIVKETTLEEYKAFKKTEEMPFAPGNQDRKFVVDHLETIYPGHEYENHHWALGIDLNSCTGCSACVVACNAENNVPVVGRKEVQRAHEMHWMRIDKYYAGEDDENPDVIFQPMMCQHCDAAPCENVCPVSATNHSSEGLNQMAYNRCFGTRYCANNCPYKVRRFNWYDYQGADSFYENTLFDNYNQTLLSNLDHSEPLSRMVMNPDVTVRSRGVMEKCSFCVQRIQDGKLKAKTESRRLEDGDIKTACQTACPADAIVFGDINNKDSKVHKWAHDSRAFRVIEEIHTLPSVYYLTKVRNKPKTEEA